MSLLLCHSLSAVFIFEPSLNVSLTAQAISRCHRVGQVREVHCYHLCMENSVEERIMAHTQSMLDAALASDASDTAVAVVDARGRTVAERDDAVHLSADAITALFN